MQLAVHADDRGEARLLLMKQLVPSSSYYSDHTETALS